MPRFYDQAMFELVGMKDLLRGLSPRPQRGSKQRCSVLMHGTADEVAARLTHVAAPFATVAASDRWICKGVAEIDERQLHKASRLVDHLVCAQLSAWWLPPASQQAMTPNFDIASTCTIDGVPGVLLVEAKAQDVELHDEAAGRRLEPAASLDRRMTHETIGAAIEAAREGLQAATSLPWGISRDRHYPMSNRFAWSWKLTALGVPVVLVYLGLLSAEETEVRGRPFAAHTEWEDLVRLHCRDLVPAEAWNRRWIVHGRPFIPLIRSTRS